MDPLKQTFSQFKVSENFISGAPYGSGHINQTYLIKTDGSRDYILQKVNHHIFKNVPKLMDNISRVTHHLRKKIQEEGGNPDRETLTLLPTKDHQAFYQDPEGAYWRMYIFITPTRSYDIVSTPKQAFEGGQAFGRFQDLLDDLPGGPLFETIEKFHDINSRFSLFEKACALDPVNRLKDIEAERNLALKFFPDMQRVLNLGKAGKIPLRVTHNDTKFNNVLLDENDQGLCVIDLDTVMPGYIHYDFSDAIRTATNTAAEDEKDLSKIHCNLALLEAFTRGFLGKVGHKLNPSEWESLPFSAKLLPFTIGLRFLTDYLNGDTYFKTRFPEHNLQRARAQFQLMQEILKLEPEIVKIVESMR